MSPDSNDQCLAPETHQDALALAAQGLPDEDACIDLAEFFKLLGDPTRLRIISALARTELCVCDLAELMQASPSAVSHQLRILRAARLVAFRREGKNAFYRLTEPRLAGLATAGQDILARPDEA